MCFTLKNKDYMIKYSVDAKWKHKNFSDAHTHTHDISGSERNNSALPRVKQYEEDLANWF